MQPFESVGKRRRVRVRRVVGKVGHCRFVQTGADMSYVYVSVAFTSIVFVLVCVVFVLVLTAQITRSILKLVVLDHHFTGLTPNTKMTAQDRREEEDPNHRKGREGR